jgi:hypothetical protein
VDETDERGNKTAWKNSKGYWIKMEYDANNNLINTIYSHSEAERTKQALKEEQA